MRQEVPWGLLISQSGQTDRFQVQLETLSQRKAKQKKEKEKNRVPEEDILKSSSSLFGHAHAYTQGHIHTYMHAHSSHCPEKPKVLPESTLTCEG